MAENLWLRCNAWPAEEASTRQGKPTRALPKYGPDGFGYWLTGDRTGPPRKRQNCLGPTPAIAPATSTAAPSCR